MNLLDTYLSEIGRRLPQKSRADIEAEIRSTLEDTLEERGQKAGKPVDDELVVEVLKEFGAPEKVAASYQGERYLIGPQLFPSFALVLKIVLWVFGVLALVGLGVGLARSSMTAESLLRSLAGVASSFITTLGNVVLVFAIIEWVMHSEGLHFKGPVKETTWDPRSLAKISPPNQVKMGEGITDIILNFAAIVIFNFYPHLVAIYNNTNGIWTSYPIFTDLFFSRFVPWLTLVWGLDIIINILVLRMGSWKMTTRLCNVAVRAGAIAILVLIMATPGVLNVTVSGTLATLARQGFASLLGIVILVEGIEIVKHLYRLVAGSK